ncbi:DNA polymerase III subunit alpha [Nibrella saemangeumensis]|uniref:DNA-directed DNA polymerase n=1 Tax=Nibrella saemangeumensis TaxID=1084526 RepID=A0ABP8N220_9BACT
MYWNVHSHYSFRYGTLSPAELVQAAVRLGISRLALTDINNTTGLYEFVSECRQAGIEPIAGVEFRNGDHLCYICLARNAEGLAEIHIFLTNCLAHHRPFPTLAPVFIHVWTIYPWTIVVSGQGGLNARSTWPDTEWIGVRARDLNHIWRYRNRLPADRLVLWQPVTFLNRAGYDLHRMLRAVQHNCLLAHLSEEAVAGEQDWFVDPDRLRLRFATHPELIHRAEYLLDSCTFVFDFHTPKNRQVYTTSKDDDLDLLRKLAIDGLQYRYGDRLSRSRSVELEQRLERELGTIHECAFSAYFLMTWDLIRYARSRGFFHVGRGSGANSLVAYCLGITDVDPVDLNLYFERFINPHRSSPPDFDIDFSWDNRDELLDYLFKRYGNGRVCLLATVVTFQQRAAMREFGRVLGLPKAELDELVDDPHKAEYHQAGRTLLALSKRLDGMPNYLSIHAGGVLISEELLTRYTALQPMPKGFPVCQFDMYTAEDIGFAKLDVLSQRGLGHIKEAVDWIRKNRRVVVDIHAIQEFKQDAGIREQLRRHETLGCFYIESPAMRQLIQKLGCQDYPTLVAASSVIRPGVAGSGMMRGYIERHYQPDTYRPLHPKLGELLAETYGIMVYQEDVIKVAHQFAGMNPAEADLLRRAMSGKYRSRDLFKRLVDRFWESCRVQGYSETVIGEIWRQMESFAGYSFSKAHSASFAVESYQSLYLKTYYPLEFIVAVINNGGGFYSPEFYVHEARRAGACIEAPDINRSEWRTIIDGTTIWLGWGLVKGLERSLMEALLVERDERPFDSVEDFCLRVPVNRAQLLLLVRVGGFRRLGLSKKEVLWRAHYLTGNRSASRPYTGRSLFDRDMESALSATSPELPNLTEHPLEEAFDHWDLLGFPLISPFQLLADDTLPPTTLPCIGAGAMLEYVGRRVIMQGYQVTTKEIYSKNNERMGFGTWLDEDGEYFDSVHFPKAWTEYPMRGRGIYWLEGVVTEEWGCPALTVTTLHRLPWQPDPRTVDD